MKEAALVTFNNGTTAEVTPKELAAHPLNADVEAIHCKCKTRPTLAFRDASTRKGKPVDPYYMTVKGHHDLACWHRVADRDLTSGGNGDRGRKEALMRALRDGQPIVLVIDDLPGLARNGRSHKNPRLALREKTPEGFRHKKPLNLTIKSAYDFAAVTKMIREYKAQNSDTHPLVFVRNRGFVWQARELAITGKMMPLRNMIASLMSHTSKEGRAGAETSAFQPYTFWFDFKEDIRNADKYPGPIVEVPFGKTKPKMPQEDLFKPSSPMRRWESRLFRVQGTPFNCGGLVESFTHNAGGHEKRFGADFVQFVIETDDADINKMLDQAIEKDEAPKIIATLDETAIRRAIYELGRPMLDRTLVIPIPVHHRDQIILPYAMGEAPRPGEKPKSPIRPHRGPAPHPRWAA